MARLPKNKVRCPVCPKAIPIEGIGRVSHLRAHTRAGDLVEVAGANGIEFYNANDSLGAAVARMRGRLTAAATSVSSG